MSLQALPNELLLLIAGSLSPNELLNLTRTSHRLSVLSSTLRKRAYVFHDASFAFIQAAARKDTPFIQSLLENRPSLRLLSEAEDLNRKPVEDRVAHTIARGPNVALYTPAGSSFAIHLAARNRHNALLRLLVSTGADVHAKDADGQTALHISTAWGNMKGARTLLSGGACINAKAEGGLTPLHIAAARSRLGMARLLLANGADTGILDDDDETPLDVAVGEGYKPLIRVLLERSAVEHGQHLERSRLHIAVLASHMPLVREILKSAAGVDVDVRDVERVSPLHLAAQEGDEEMVALLLRAGADVNAVDHEGMTPLHHAAEYGPEVFDALIEAGADVSATDAAGHTPLALAAEREKKKE